MPGSRAAPRWRLGWFIVVSCLACVSATAAVPQDRLDGYLRVERPELVYAFAVRTKFEEDGTKRDQTLTVTCERGCAATELLAEAAPGIFISLFRTDVKDRIFTIWASAVTYVIVVFDIRDGRLRKVFLSGSRSFPLWTYKSAAGDTLILSRVKWRDRTRYFVEERYHWSAQVGTYVPGK